MGLDTFLECMQGEMDIQDLRCIQVWELKTVISDMQFMLEMLN
jgi:hypothetical protein